MDLPSQANIKRSYTAGRGDAFQALQALKQLVDKTVNPDEDREALLRRLGKNSRQKRNPGKEHPINSLHQLIVTQFSVNDINTQYANSSEIDRALGCLETIASKNQQSLQYLLAQGSYDRSILHIIIDPSIEIFTQSVDFESIFNRLKPLVRLLLQLQPDLPEVKDSEGRPPIFTLIAVTNGSKYKLTRTLKQSILSYFCDDAKSGNLQSNSAIQSLAIKASHAVDNSPLTQCHTIHLAIEGSIRISEAVISQFKGPKVWKEPPCLLASDSLGRTCLHLALTAPFSREKISWAKILAGNHPQLLEKRFKPTQGSGSVTPMQHFNKQRGENNIGHDKSGNGRDQDQDNIILELEALEQTLKRYCLAEFDTRKCKKIMYTRDNGKTILSDSPILNHPSNALMI